MGYCEKILCWAFISTSLLHQGPRSPPFLSSCHSYPPLPIYNRLPFKPSNMGFWKRLTEFLFIHRFTDQTKFSHTYSPVQDLSLVDAFDAKSIDGACNSPTNRKCWSTDFDIYTDYEEIIPEGKVRKVSHSSVAL